MFGVLKDGARLTSTTLLPISQEEYINGFVTLLSWEKPPSLAAEFQLLSPRWRGSECTTNIIAEEFGIQYSNVLRSRLEAYLANLAAEDSELTNSAAALKLLGASAHEFALYENELRETFLPRKFDTNDAEFERRCKEFYLRHSTKEGSKGALELVMARRKATPREGKALDLLWHRRCALWPTLLSISNQVWLQARANLVIQHAYSNSIVGTTERTNRFLASLPDRFPINYLVTEDLAMAKQSYEAGVKTAVVSSSPPHRMPGPVFKIDFQRRRTSEKVLRQLFAQEGEAPVFPAASHFPPESKSPFLTELRREAGMAEKPCSVVLLVGAPDRTVASEPLRWKHFCADDELEQRYQRIRSKFEHINPALFPPKEEMRWLVAHGPRFPGFNR